MSRVVLEGLEFFGRHGVFEAEMQLGARFVVDAELQYDFANLNDDISEAVNYAEAYALIARLVTQERFDLIETLAARIARDLLAAHAPLQAVTVRVHKPSAPIVGIFRDIYAELTLKRGDLQS